MNTHAFGPDSIEDFAERCFGAGKAYNAKASLLKGQNANKVFAQRMQDVVPKGEDAMIDALVSGSDFAATFDSSNNPKNGLWVQHKNMIRNPFFPPKLSFADTRAKPVKVKNIDLMPDTIVYHEDHPCSTLKEADFAAAALVIEAKTLGSDDPFEEVTTSIPDEEGSGCRQRVSVRLKESKSLIIGQLADYIGGMSYATSRTHSFLVTIAKGKARISRWDHSALIVTEQIDLCKEPWKFAAFLHVFADATASDRGRDSTVQVINTRAATNIKQRFQKALSTDTQGSSPMRAHWEAFRLARYLIKFTVDDRRNPGRKFVLVAAQDPSFSSPTLLGRFTRCWAVCPVDPLDINYTDIDVDTLYYLKKVWRVDLPQVEPEHVIYQRLVAGGVRHIPTWLGSGDTGDDADPNCRWHRAIFSQLSKKDLLGLDGKILEVYRPLRQYAFLMEEVGTPLFALKTTQEVVSVVHDVAEGPPVLLSM
jgi:hypothetical protein